MSKPKTQQAGAQADPKLAEGARRERKAMRAKLARMLSGPLPGVTRSALSELQSWVTARQERYDRARGGLGRDRASAKSAAKRRLWPSEEW